MHAGAIAYGCFTLFLDLNGVTLSSIPAFLAILQFLIDNGIITLGSSS